MPGTPMWKEDQMAQWLLALILAMLAIGAALEHSGAVTLIMSWATPGIEGLSPVLIIWLVYLLTSMLTEMVSNNAVAVVVNRVPV